MHTFALSVDKPLAQVPVLNGYSVKLLDPITLEVEVHRNQSISELFYLLAQQHITVTDMQSKTNRLEELFLLLTAKQ